MTATPTRSARTRPEWLVVVRGIDGGIRAHVYSSKPLARKELAYYTRAGLPVAVIDASELLDAAYREEVMTVAVRSTPQFQALIRAQRSLLRLTLEQVAERTDVAVSFISRMESGERTPSDKHLTKLADALSLDPIDLFFSLGRIAPALRGNEDVRRALHRAAQGDQT